MGAFATTNGGTLLPSVISLGIVMATLSTAGAAVMVLSMAIAKDMYRRFVNRKVSDDRVINASRVALGAFLVFTIVIAFTPDLTIWAWTQLKFEFLLQATPVFVFGLYVQRVKSDFAIAGMLAGCLTAIAIYFLGSGSVYGIPADVVGLVVNSAVLVGGSYATGESEETERARELLQYNAIEYSDGDDADGVRYTLPAQKASFWVGLVIVLALMVPWYAPESWNARAALGLPIWTWVILGSLVLKTLFVLYGTVIWRRKPLEGTAETIETPRDVGGDD